MPPHTAFLGLGTAITDVLAFLGPADQHKLRCTSAAMCEWFDSAAENGSLAFFVTFASDAPLRWKHATADPHGSKQKANLTGSRRKVNLLIPRATVTVHARNYCLSTFNEARGEADDAIIGKAPIELVDKFAFEHKLVVTGLFGIRSIGDGFCCYVKSVEVEFTLKSQLQINSNQQHVDLTGFGSLEQVGGSWLSECSNLESIAFAGVMSKLTKVGNKWMSDCWKLKHIDLTGFTALEEVENYWMYNCMRLESVTFAGDMPNLRKIGYCWMNSCTSLTHIYLTGFTALEEVGDYWMSSCSSLESITFEGGMPRLKRVGDGWMSGCSNLKHVDLAGFGALEEVGKDWLSSCPKLKHVDFTGCKVLEEVGRNWLRGCPSLESIAFAEDMSNLNKVGNNWTPKSECTLSDHLLQISRLAY